MTSAGAAGILRRPRARVRRRLSPELAATTCPLHRGAAAGPSAAPAAGLERRPRGRAVNRIWVLPALLVVVGVVAALGLSEIDKAAGYDLVPASVVGTATTAQQVLSLLA